MAEWESIGGHPSGLPESESEAETDSVSGEGKTLALSGMS